MWGTTNPMTLYEWLHVAKGKTCLNNWLPKTIKWLKLNPNITKLSPAVVVCYSKICQLSKKKGLLVPSILVLFHPETG